MDYICVIIGEREQDVHSFMKCINTSYLCLLSLSCLRFHLAVSVPFKSWPNIAQFLVFVKGAVLVCSFFTSFHKTANEDKFT